MSYKDITSTIKYIESMINRCRKIQPKFKIGTSQATLLKNRIRALEISADLLMEKNKYSLIELEKALPPILSIIHKCEKAQSKYTEDNIHYKKYIPTIEAMNKAKEAIEFALEKIKE